MNPEGQVSVELEGVPETLLWTLYHRATEAARPDTVLRDPKAVELLARIDFPFEARFGPAGAIQSQWQALRAACFDRQVVRFLADRPDATVVALGEGLETQFWRVDNGRVRWLTVDLPETIAVRRALLPEPPRGRLLAGSALDTRWLDEVDTAAGVLVTAQGLLMYLAPADVHDLLRACAGRIPAGALLFDAVSRRLSERSMRGPLGGSGGYTPPPWTWGIDAQERRFIRGLDHVAALETLRLPRGRGPVFGYLVPVLGRLPRLRHGLLSIMLARLRE
ncbi:MAG: class I SAM-dependent methyltransferase [Jatrophihabitantaceae bacterium]